MKILGLLVQDFKRIEAVELRPGGAVVEITGRNGAGKSTVLDAIEAALGGKKRSPKTPIRRGAEKARVVLELDGLVVERVWTEKTDRIVVKNEEGAAYPSPQSKLDELIGGLSFDPLAFMNLEPKEQREILLGLLGVDLAAFGVRRQEAYDLRRDVNRDLARARVAATEDDDLPKESPGEEVSSAELVAEYQAALLAEREQEQVKRRAQEIGGEIEEARRRLAALEEESASLAEKIAGFIDPGADGIKSRLDSVEETNAAIRRWKAAQERAQEVVRLAAESEALTEKIAGIDAEKEAALAAAAMPVEGLGVEEEGVTYEGLPLAQAALSRRVRICTQISARLNPYLKIALVRDGNDLDDDVLRAFYEEATAAGLEQVWVERRSGVSGDAVEIVEGHLAVPDAADDSPGVAS